MLSSRKSLNQLKCYAEDVKDAIDESPLPPVPPNSLCDNGKIMCLVGQAQVRLITRFLFLLIV